MRGENGTSGCKSRTQPSVHPHMRGENATLLSEKETTAGTPPHAWGKPQRAHIRTNLSWYTPTCVGKTHPRHGSVPHQIGTPPHAWGKQLEKMKATVLARYTPTCVGKTGGGRAHQHGYAVHPHMRGENLYRAAVDSPQIGTPPHAWGKPPELLSACRDIRYTPTCVGKTLKDRFSHPQDAVHPHMRGKTNWT